MQIKSSTIIVTIEIISFIACIIFVGLWIKYPNGPYESLSALSGLFTFGTELYRRYEGKLFKTEGKSFTPGELVQHSEKLRKIFEQEISKCRAENLRKDVIIRHVNRVDSYPDVNENGKGISPWFRIWLLDTYHRGILVGLRFGSLKECPDGYRLRDYINGEEGDIKLFLVGEIPFKSIETVNMDGDEYYPYPHIFCHFDHNGEPYERLFFCEEISKTNGHPYYKEIVSYESVMINSKAFGLDTFA
jgi:hypothetical protein